MFPRLVAHREQLLRRPRLRTARTALRGQLRNPDAHHCRTHNEPSPQICHIFIKPKPVEGVAVFFV